MKQIVRTKIIGGSTEKCIEKIFVLNRFGICFYLESIFREQMYTQNI